MAYRFESGHRHQKQKSATLWVAFFAFLCRFWTQTHFNAKCQWHLAATSSKTGGIYTICPRANRPSSPVTGTTRTMSFRCAPRQYCTQQVICGRATTIEFVGADSIRPVVSPWETTSAQCADNGSIEHFVIKFGGIMSKHGIFCNIATFPGQIGSAQKFATLVGG